LSDLRKLDENRELKRTRILELVDEDGLHAFAQLDANILSAEKREGQPVLIDEVDEAPCPLVALVSGHGLGRAGEDAADVRFDLAEQSRVAGERARGGDDLREGVSVRDRDVELGQLRPFLPRLILDPS
jgi:hypothetical protein